MSVGYFGDCSLAAAWRLLSNVTVIGLDKSGFVLLHGLLVP